MAKFVSIVTAINCATALLTGWLAVTPVSANAVAIGDSLAVGFGQASRVPTIAKVGISSCRIAGMVPTRHYDTVLLSAGTNDPPGACVEKLRQLVAERIQPSKVVWVMPVNGARSRVLQLAARWGNRLLHYSPGKGRAWPHPKAYWKVL